MRDRWAPPAANSNTGCHGKPSRPPTSIGKRGGGTRAVHVPWTPLPFCTVLGPCSPSTYALAALCRVDLRLNTVPPLARDALQGKGPQRRPQERLDRRLEEVAKAVGGGYCRLQLPLKLALAVREAVAGHRLRNPPPPLQCIRAPPSITPFGSPAAKWATDKRESLLRGTSSPRSTHTTHNDETVSPRHPLRPRHTLRLTDHQSRVCVGGGDPQSRGPRWRDVIFQRCATQVMPMSSRRVGG